jgi:hypothetical protein
MKHLARKKRSLTPSRWCGHLVGFVPRFLTCGALAGLGLLIALHHDFVRGARFQRWLLDRAAP